jgi:hypothetical protein
VHESVNYVFKKAVDWTPQPIPKLTTTLLNVVRIQHVSLKRSLYGTGNYELCGRYKRHSVSHQCWFSKTLEQRERLFQKLLNDHTPLVTVVKSTLQISKFRNPINLPRNLTRTNDLEPIVHSQDIKTFFFHPSTHYVFRTITELIEILYIVFCFCHIILNTHSTSNKYMYIKKNVQTNDHLFFNNSIL